jgi:conjugative relaxase-like TrwC/TraI family protein
MMSVSKGRTAEHAGGYFSKEDYYLRGAEQGRNSRWCGEGAGALGLDGRVGVEDFRALCRGEDLDGVRIVDPNVTYDKKTGERVETRRAGNDCTFSPPKSFSILYAAGVDQVREAHDAAVISVLGHLEAHYCHYSSPQGIRNGKLVAAKFDHATSRNVDPQLHSHVFVVNAVLTPSGDWKANDPNAIFQDQKSLGLLYRQELAREVQARGFEILVQNRSQMFFEIAGVDPRLIEYFSSRRKDIEKQVALWRKEKKFVGVAHARLYEMAALETRDPKREFTREDVTGIFERGFQSCGTSMARVKLEHEEACSLRFARMREERLPGDPAARVLELAVRDLTGREAVLDRARLMDQAVRISGGRHHIEDLNAAIDGGVEGGLRLGQNSYGREIYSTAAMLELERGNLERVRKLSRASFLPAAQGWEIEEYRRSRVLEGVRPTAGQLKEFDNEVAGRGGIAITVGDPGTAKTFSLGEIERFYEEVLKPQGRDPFRIDLASTGKAAREMSLATGRPAFTVASFTNAYATSKFDLQEANGEPLRLRVAGEEILIPEGRQVILRVDEASFLGARQARLLLEAVEDLQGRGIQAKLHLLGDTKQMQAVEAGDFLRQVRELGVSGEVDYAHLTEILRQRDPELLEIARGLNREDRALGENAREALGTLEKRGSVTEMADLQELKAAAVEHYLRESRKLSQLPKRAAAGELQSVVLMVATNDERRELNDEIRTERVQAGEIGEGRSYPVLIPVRQGVTVESYQLGDTVRFSGVEREDGKMMKWQARLGTESEVTGIDRERNLVRVSYSFSTKKKDGREIARSATKELSAAEMAGRTTLLREQERRFAVGDRIIALRNDKKHDLQNGMMGVIKELDDKGRALVDCGKKEVVVDLDSYRQVDHGYAVTVHKSQGATVEHSIMFATVKPDPAPGVEVSPAVHYGRASYNALNVAVTRAQFETRIFTNSVQGLARSVEIVDGKSSALRGVTEPHRETGRDLQGREASGPGSGRKLYERIQELTRKVRGPGVQEKEPGLELPGAALPARSDGLPVRGREIASVQKVEVPKVAAVVKELELKR